MRRLPAAMIARVQRIQARADAENTRLVEAATLTIAGSLTGQPNIVTDLPCVVDTDITPQPTTPQPDMVVRFRAELWPADAPVLNKTHRPIVTHAGRQYTGSVLRFLPDNALGTVLRLELNSVTGQTYG